MVSSWVLMLVMFMAVSYTHLLLLFLASAGYALVRFAVTSCVGTDHVPELPDPVCGDGVMHPFSLFVVIYKSAVRKDLHVMRKSRLCDICLLYTSRCV